MGWTGFVAFEGIDGSGKSSVLELVRKRLEGLGALCLPTKMNSWLDAGATRVIIEARERRRGHAREAIERAHHRDLLAHGEDFIDPARAHGVVLQDRSFVSAAVYQDVLFGSSARRLLERYRSSGVPIPDLIVFVSLAPSEAAARLARRESEPRSWENEKDLEELHRVFKRVLLDQAPPWLPPVVIYDNGRLPGQVSDDEALLERIVSVCAAGS